MRALLVLLLVACQQKAERAPDPAPPPPPARADAHVDPIPAGPIAPADAPPVIVGDPRYAAADAGVPDDADHSFDLFNSETVGPLRPGLPATLVVRELGPPTSKSTPTYEAATGDYTSAWKWPHAALMLSADKPAGPFTARSVSITGPATWETRKHIHIGSTRADVEKAYTRSADDDGKPDSFLAGSMYGGLLFTFEHDVVASISLGAFAF